MLLRWMLPALAALLMLAGCGRVDEPPPPLRQSPFGITVAESAYPFAPTLSRLDSVLQTLPAVRVVARVNHAANADRAGLSLRPTRVVLFGTPRLGTPLMQKNPLAGLDLPQKMLAYETPDGRAILVYNSAGYLAQRHGLAGVETLPALRQALQRIAAAATDSAVTPMDSTALAQGRGIVQLESDFSVDSTFQRLQRAVTRNDALRLVTTVNHTANAARVGLELPPLRLLIFGNPQLSTPLMQDAPTIALDLPQKMLVYRAPDGAVRVAYNDPFFLAERHVVTDQRKRLQTMANALQALAQQATTES